ncbi:hypothetical protein AALA17_00880 [Lactobacillaceae bacterium 24-114]
MTRNKKKPENNQFARRWAKDRTMISEERVDYRLDLDSSLAVTTQS